MNWERARVLGLIKWDDLASMAQKGAAATEEFRQKLLEGCAFCASAEEEIRALGLPKVKMYACDFCRGYLDVGGCQEPVQAVLDAVDAGDWPRVRSEVAKIQELLKSIAAH